MKQLFNYFSLLSLLMCLSTTNSTAAFVLKKKQVEITQSERPHIDMHQMFVGNKPQLPSLLASHPTKNIKSGVVAYLAAGLGIVGLAIGSVETTLIMMILGLAAGVFGKVGLNMYKRKPFLRFLCYTGIVLGALLVLFASVPILFLV